MWNVNVACFGLLIVWLPSNTLAVNRGQIIAKTLDVTSSDDFTKGATVSLEVFYESLCPDCVQFFQRRLAPAVRALGSYLNVTLNPYGHAQRGIKDGHRVFRCQHGPRECRGNALHACAAAALRRRPARAALYAACLMGRASDDDAVDQCSQEFRLSPATIKACANSDAGGELLHQMGERSDQVGYPFVPYLVVNGRALNDSDSELLPTLCGALERPPPPCASPASPALTTTPPATPKPRLLQPSMIQSRRMKSIG